MFVTCLWILRCCVVDFGSISSICLDGDLYTYCRCEIVHNLTLGRNLFYHIASSIGQSWPGRGCCVLVEMDYRRRCCGVVAERAELQEL